MRCSTDESRCYGYTLDGQRRSRDAVVVYEMFNGGVEMPSLYIRYGQRRSRDAVVVYEMFNGGVKMISLYIRWSTDESRYESRCYGYTLDGQRWSQDAVVVYEMFNGGVEMLSCSMEESRCYRYTLDLQRMSGYAIVVHEMFNRGVKMLSLYIRFLLLRPYTQSNKATLSSTVGWVGCDRRGVGGLNGEGGSDGSNGVCGSTGEGGSTSIKLDVVEQVWVNDKSREHITPHNQGTWNEVTPVNIGNTHGEGKSSNPMFVLTRIPSTPRAAMSLKYCKSLSRAEGTLETKLFEEAKEENRRQYEEKLKVSRIDNERRNGERIECKDCQMFAQYAQQLPVPPPL
ncbi:hypothetical protein Tco_0266669 [Tanacetum coccineum]